MNTVESASYELCRILKKNYDEYSQKYLSPSVVNGMTYEVVPGRKYDKIVQINVLSNSVHSSVHAFVDKKTGDLYKPASWNAPAKHVRFNLLKDMETLKTRADWAGSYLYIR